MIDVRIFISRIHFSDSHRRSNADVFGFRHGLCKAIIWILRAGYFRRRARRRRLFRVSRINGTNQSWTEVKTRIKWIILWSRLHSLGAQRPCWLSWLVGIKRCFLRWINSPNVTIDCCTIAIFTVPIFAILSAIAAVSAVIPTISAVSTIPSAVAVATISPAAAAITAVGYHQHKPAQ
jgi:hypothetical protein